MKDGYG
jgi:hypothetical protein